MKINRKFTEQEVGLIGRTMMQGASLDDVALFVATCERTGLDPFAGQVMPTGRQSSFKDPSGNWQKKTTWAPLVRIDGLRKIAVDSGDYAGQEGPWWCGEDGVWKDVWLAKTPPSAAKVIVHRKGFTHGLPAVALFSAYAQTVKDKDTQKQKLNNIWASMGDMMIAKCAEALALRKAFPNEMAGLYTADEMAQAGVVPPAGLAPEGAVAPAAPVPPSEAPPATPTPAQAQEPASKGNAWPNADDERFHDLMDRVYSILKSVGSESAYPQKQEEWNARRLKEQPGPVLVGLQDFVGRLQAAADKKLGKPVQWTEAQAAEFASTVEGLIESGAEDLIPSFRERLEKMEDPARLLTDMLAALANAQAGAE